MIRTSLINGVINLDSDFSKYIESLSNPGVIEGFNVQDGVVKPGKARVKAERTNGETIYCYVENTEDVSLSGNDGKVYIVIDQEDIDSGLVSEDGLNIARIEEGEVRPVKNFLKLVSIDSGDVTDERYFLTNVSELGSAVNNYGPSTSGSDAYEVSIQGVTEYKVGNVYRFMADVDNEGNATLNINGLGAVEIRKNHDKILDNGDIEAGQIVEVAYDGTYFQMDSQVATVVSVVGMGNTQTTAIPAYENLQSKDGCTIIDTSTYNFGKNELGRLCDTVTSKIYGNGEQSTDSFSIKIQRVGSDLSGTLHAQILDGEDVLYSTSVPRYEISDTVQDLTLNFGTIQLVYLKEYTLKLYTDSTDAENYYIINNQGDLIYKSIFEYPTEVISGTWDGTGDVPASDSTLLTTCSGTGIDISLGLPGAGYATHTAYFTFNKNDSSFTIKIAITRAGYSSGYYTSVVSLSNNGGEEEQIFSIQNGGNYYKIDVKNGILRYNNTKYNIETAITDYTSITTRFVCGYNRSVGVLELQTTTVNIISDSVQNKRAKKIAAAGDIKGILVCQSPVIAKQEGIFEIGGISSIFKDGTGDLYQQTDGSITNNNSGYKLGTYNNLGLFYYKFEPPLQLPTQNTDFYLGKDAIMVCDFSHRSDYGSVATCKIKQDGNDYRIWSFGGQSGSSSSNALLSQTMEWRLRGGHTYQIDFNPSAIKEFYHVD